MRVLSKVFHFLGSFYFAIIIITLMAIIVTAGTFTESYTDSHQYAALFTYSNPVFNGVLVALFINILFSALRRWPFQKKHIPFLITHLGLLMLISGVIAKNLWGLQGYMALTEGGMNDTIILPQTQVVRVEQRDSKNPLRIISREFPVVSNFWNSSRSIKISDFPGLSLDLVEYCPHCEERWDSWIQRDQGNISGLEPFPVFKTDDHSSNIPVSTKVKIYRDINEVWDVYAIETDEPEIVIQQVFEPAEEIARTPKIAFIKAADDNVTVYAKDRYGNTFSKNYPATDITPLVVYNEGFGGYFATATIPFPAYPYDSETVDQAKIHRVTKQLRHQNIATGELSPPLQLLHRACDRTNSDFAYSLSQIYQNQIPADVAHTLKQLEWSLLPQEVPTTCYWVATINYQLETSPGSPLPEVIKKLEEGDSLIAEVQSIAHNLPKYSHDQQHPDEITLGMFQALLEYYGVDLNFLCPQMSENETRQCLIEFLEETITESKLMAAFPPLKTLPFQQKISVLEKLSENHEVVKELIPPTPLIDTLPTYSRPDLWEELDRKIDHHEITLETPITPIYTSLPPTKKLEENRPKITLFAKEGHQKQFISLGYDAAGQMLKWPVIQGKYRLSFQPETKKLPLSIRLHDARQINYPNSNQPLSFEADIIPSSGSEEEIVTVSMNDVYESPQGYRFYLSNITPGDESAVQHVHLVVNYDPAKYILTYPGGILIALGTLLLFWFRRFTS